MVNRCIEIGLQNNIHTLKKLSAMSYRELAKYNEIPSCYKICAISKAVGILSNRNQSIKRGIRTKNPYLKRLILISYYGFKFDGGIFKIPIGNRKYFEILLNYHSKNVLSDNSLKINSFTLTLDSISIAYSREITPIKCIETMGIDRNLRNITVGNFNQVIQYDISKTVKIAETTKSIISSFKRHDFRIRTKLYTKYGTRRKNRTNQLLHKVSKDIIQRATRNRDVLVFEDIRYIKRLYQKGNRQGKKYRGTMNNWSFSEIKRQIEYKARWNGIPVVQLSKKETRGTSILCPKCGKRLQEQRTLISSEHYRELWCEFCKRWFDRDVVAVMNQSLRGLSKLDSSKGDAGEAMKGNLGNAMPVILRVDASKLPSSDLIDHLL